MPVWLQVVAVLYPPAVLTAGILRAQKKILDKIHLYFDEDSEVTKVAGGTLPVRVSVLEEEQ